MPVLQKLKDNPEIVSLCELFLISVGLVMQFVVLLTLLNQQEILVSKTNSDKIKTRLKLVIMDELLPTEEGLANELQAMTAEQIYQAATKRDSLNSVKLETIEEVILEMYMDGVLRPRRGGYYTLRVYSVKNSGE